MYEKNHESLGRKVLNHISSHPVHYLIGGLVLSGALCYGSDKSTEDNYNDNLALDSGERVEMLSTPEKMDSLFNSWQEIRPTISMAELERKIESYSGNYPGREQIWVPTFDENNYRECIFIDGKFIPREDCITR